MATVNVRKQGGAAVITIPANEMKMLHIEVGSKLELNVSEGGSDGAACGQQTPLFPLRTVAGCHPHKNRQAQCRNSLGAERRTGRARDRMIRRRARGEYD